MSDLTGGADGEILTAMTTITESNQGYQSNRETVWSEKSYAPWQNPVDRKNSVTRKKRSIRQWRRKKRNEERRSG
jgi:hypothetical protein